MDHGGHCEREGPDVAQCQSDPTCDNLPDPQALGRQNLNLQETHAPSPTQTLPPEHSPRVCPGEDIRRPPHRHSNNNGEDEDKEEDEDEVADELMEDDESEESAALIRCLLPGTPMTDSSFSGTGSLLDTPFSPGTRPEPLSHLNPGASPGTSPEPLSLLNPGASPGTSPEPLSLLNPGASPGTSPEPLSLLNPGASPGTSPEPLSLLNPGASPGTSPEPLSLLNPGASPGTSPEPLSLLNPGASPGTSPEPLSPLNPGTSPEPLSPLNPGASPEPLSLLNPGASPGTSPEPLSPLNPGASPGTSPEPLSPLNPGATPEAPCPVHSPAEPRRRDPDGDSHFSIAGSEGAGGGFTSCVAAGPADTTGPVDSSRLASTSTVGPSSASSAPVCVAGAATADALNASTGSNAELAAISTEGSTSTDACDADLSISVVAEISSTAQTTGTKPTRGTEPFVCTTAPNASPAGAASVTLATCATWPSTSAPGPTSVSAPTSATGPIPRPALLAYLEQLEHRGDDTHLPQYLHQIAEAFVNQDDYQRAIWCIQLERLYHQRLLDNLGSLQKQWESSCRSAPNSDLGTRMDALTRICQTHNRPATRDAVCASLELLKPTMTHDEKPPGELTTCPSGRLTKGETEAEQTDTEPRLSGTMEPIASSAGRDHLDGARLTAGEEGAGTSSGAEGGAVHMAPPITAGSGIPPATGGEMDRSKSAEGQGAEGEATQEKEDREEEEEEEEERETWESREDVHALEMEDKGGGGGEKAEEEEEGAEAVPEETELGGIEELVPLLQQEAVAGDNQWEVTQLCLNSQQDGAQLQQDGAQLQQDGAQLQQEVTGRQEEQGYGAGVNRETYHLDDQAKLITVEEVTPACGLVSILKKRSVCVSACSEPLSAPAKRRVRFKVANDGYDQEVGGGDSCLLLFLLCLATVVISIGGTALYCALGDAHSTVCQDFSRNADFYVGQMQRGISHLQHWLAPPGS